MDLSEPAMQGVNQYIKLRCLASMLTCSIALSSIYVKIKSHLSFFISDNQSLIFSSHPKAVIINKNGDPPLLCSALPPINTVSSFMKHLKIISLNEQRKHGSVNVCSKRLTPLHTAFFHKKSGIF